MANELEKELKKARDDKASFQRRCVKLENENNYLKRILGNPKDYVQKVELDDLQVKHDKLLVELTELKRQLRRKNIK